MDGLGETKDKARFALFDRFENAKREEIRSGKRLPRPGTKVPIKFGSQQRVSVHPELAQDFIQRVLGLEWAWISDESSLWHFHFGEDDGALYAKIPEVYGVDVSEMGSGNIAKILERIGAARETDGAQLHSLER